LNTLINNLPGMVYRFKGENIWSMDFVSDNSIVITGYKPEELTHDKVISYYSIINPEDKKRIFDQVQKAIEERKPYQLLYRINTSSGYEKWVWEQGVGVFSEATDELLALEGFITDITEQKAVEDQLNLQSNALEAAANGIVIMDNNGLVIWCNTAFSTLTGYLLKEIVGKTLDILKSPNVPAEIYEVMWNTVTNGSVWHGELINRRKDGIDYYEDTTITPVKNTTGEIKYFISIKQDITDRKSAEEFLRESELRFRGLYENATIGLYRTTPDGKILMANPTLLKILGVDSLNELVKINAANIYFDPNERELFLRELNYNEKVFGFETRYKKKDNSLIYIRESARVVRNDNRQIAYIEGTIEDISEKKLVEIALIDAKERAEKSDKLKSEFLAQMSHEIRTPLNVILNFSSILKEELEEHLEDDLKDSFNVIDTEGKRITRTVELILNMSELQTGSYNFKSNKFDLYESTLAILYKSFKYIAEQKRVFLNFENRIGEAIINADEYSVNQIFYHLI
ncbi:PAS domain S-box protein, partial [Candidatus Nomurabacteria bacterium]|nr:PAS domain S-box protein [Candidatus Nomurabacteria bacterium]